MSFVVLISHALSYTTKTHNKLEHTCENHQACSHSNSNALRNPQSIRFSGQNRSSAVDIQISWIRDISGKTPPMGKSSLEQIYIEGLVIHQFAQARFPEEPPQNEQEMLIYADFSDSAGL